MTYKTVRIQDGNSTRWEMCRHDTCIGHECQRYERCCGEVALGNMRWGDE